MIRSKSLASGSRQNPSLDVDSLNLVSKSNLSLPPLVSYVHCILLWVGGMLSTLLILKKISFREG